MMAAARSVPVALVGLVLAGAGQMLTMTTVYSLFMVELPSWVRGRASSVVMLVVWLGASAGAFGWGALASRVGIGTALGVSAAAQVVVTGCSFVALRLERADTFAR
jgi:hypothetical protein